jgi:Fe2+ transport system protein B
MAQRRCALPARSPMPLMVDSTCRTPARIAASVLATARPRSLWLCVDSTTLSAPGTRVRTMVKMRSMSSGSA